MSDLIDREALLRQIDIDSEGEPGYYGDTWKFIDTIKRMPSALGTNLAEVGTGVPDINVGDINKFIDSFEEIFADIRERHVDDSVCGLCEYDGAYIGQSGDWCNECPGFDRDDCFKLSDKCRKRWIDTITKALPSAQPATSCSEIPNSSTDCISRQAAIDYFVTNVGFHDEDGYPIEDECKLREIWTGYFDGIPSAQPKNENLKFLEFLWNTINPNEMEQYLEMYSSKEVKSNG